jgi:hypothetical protein
MRQKDMGVNGRFYVRTFINYAIIDKENNRVSKLWKVLPFTFKKEKRGFNARVRGKLLGSVAVIMNN